MYQISFSVTVAKEQERQATADVDNPTFAPASLAPLAGMSMKRQDSNEGSSRPLHPMFRRMSTSSSTGSRSNSVPPDVKSDVSRSSGTKNSKRSNEVSISRPTRRSTKKESQGKANSHSNSIKEEKTNVKLEPGLYEDDAIEIPSSGDDEPVEIKGSRKTRPAVKRDQSDLTPIDEVVDPIHRQAEDDPAS